jgi:hypothetical protein
MVEKKKSGYNFRIHKGDHPAYHVHIIKDGRLIGRWDIENQRPMDKFELTSKLKKALADLGYIL